MYATLIYKEKSLIYKNFNLDQFYFFTRYGIEQTIIEISNVIVIKNNNEKQFYQATEVVNEMTFYIYVYFVDNLVYIALTDKDYPTSVTLQFFQDLYKNDMSLYNEIWKKYQNPNNVNSIAKIKSEVDNTKKIMLDSIDKLLERGDKINDLIEKTDQLEFNSQAFRMNAQKLNSCCTIL